MWACILDCVNYDIDVTVKCENYKYVNQLFIFVILNVSILYTRIVY